MSAIAKKSGNKYENNNFSKHGGAGDKCKQLIEI
jgi:hypothetical protein